MRLTEDSSHVLCDQCDNWAAFHITPSVTGERFGPSYSIHACTAHLVDLMPHEEKRKALVAYLGWNFNTGEKK